MCPACSAKRLHGPEDWLQHPYAGHGFNGQAWTHPDLPTSSAGAASLGKISGEISGAAAPVGGQVKL
jgi:hypothetical protein